MASMRHINSEVQYAPIDSLLIYITLCLVVIGIAMVFSASSVKLDDPYHYLTKQCISVSIGIVVMFTAAFTPRSIINKIHYPFLLLAVCLLALTLTPYGISTSKNVSRWIALGPFSFQPFEVVKPALILYLGYFISTKQQYKDKFWYGTLPPLLFTSIIAVILYKQPDIGGMLTLIFLTFTVCFIGGIKFLHLISVFGLIGSIASALIYFSASKQYVLERLIGFWNPTDHIKDYSYHIFQSLCAFGSGGLSGVGIGNSAQKIRYLPEAHTDFIMAVLGEEIGFIGITVIMILFLLLFRQCYLIVIRQKDFRDRISSCGLSLVLCFGIIHNLAVVLGAMPAKGVAMPFLSYGGSCLVSSMLCVGLLLNYSRTVR